MYEDEISLAVQALPESLKREVLDYTEFLLSKYEKRKQNKGNFKFNWEGALADIDEDVTSVELQHRAMEWR